ncbi:hypothetical protein, partial [Pseudotabrizicola sp.]|uniref:hypothetical protein n=1 Tax=Pseudotabrizicola sp. TaxID=2939647 RepID=UPI00272223F7
FSEKTIDWPGGDLNTAWCRWTKRALRASAKQAKGAERWISEFPERVFLDRNCTIPFPIEFPTPENRTVHRVLVARGASSAYKNQFGGSSGSLIISPDIKGDAHWSNAAGRIQPFTVGDIDPDGSFVHVFDEVALDIVLRELDTIRDFTDYLMKRAEFIRSGKLAEAHGEENLLAFYAIRINADGDHDFVVDQLPTPIVIDRKRYSKLASDPRYIAKRQEDKVSYAWDMLIDSFTTNMLNGTSITPEGYSFDLRRDEAGIREMALLSRYLRRAHGQAFLGALEKGKDVDRFCRVIMAPAGAKDCATAFFIQTFNYAKWIDFLKEKGGYETYRQKRTDLAIIFGKGLLERYPHLRQVIGISREPLGQDHGVSEDLVCIGQTEWTDDERQKIREDCEALNMLQDVRENHWRENEFPDVETIVIQRSPRHLTNTSLNRQQRRALTSKQRKKRK